MTVSDANDQMGQGEVPDEPDHGSTNTVAPPKTKPAPPKTRHKSRNVQGGISVRTIFIIGQVKPHNSVMAARRRNPMGGRFSPALFSEVECVPMGWDVSGT